ncbi:Protein kinase superfamily protein [Rhynchospora pubera]|uniref:Protein kinase superfamily protein n=1 Tax=Rhynchospora pubera TaxID=906938 RepID=A0AAV8G4T0_9POAL|nr:Protein kinase superfamily protein [Rhynchospora pubera]
MEKKVGKGISLLSRLPLCFFVSTFLLSASAEQSSTSCQVGWEVNPENDRCYMYVATPQNWYNTDKVCNGLKGHLAVLTSTQDLTFTQSLCSSLSGCWVGAHGYNVSSFIFSGWNQPITAICTSSNCTEMCGLVLNGRDGLVGERCNASHGIICMTDHSENKSKEYMMILVIVSSLILVITLAVVVWLLVYRRSKRKRRSRNASSLSTSALVPPLWRVFTSEEVRLVTKNFSEGSRLPGNAKTGGTYSGVLPDGSRVAVKRLKRSSLQRKKEFYSEIGRVARLHHPSLVAVKGCCYDHGERYIVYEFIPNGPLDKWLHHVPRGGRTLDWGMRMRIATTLAQGIAFLHDKVKPQVVHRDIRASNVLLGEDFRAHLMGVGLSKFVPWDVMHERTVTAAKYGYLAPEFIYRNELTTKSDVYSFGVLLLEIVSGRRPALSVDSVGGFQTIFEWATPLVQANRYVELVDPVVQDMPEPGVVQKVVDLVYACTQHVPSVRPRMSHVVHQLHQVGLKAGFEYVRSGTSSASAASPMVTPLQVHTPR